MSLTSDKLFEWREHFGHLARLLHGIRDDGERRRAARIVDALEREVHEAFRDDVAVDRCACATSTLEPITMKEH